MSASVVNITSLYDIDRNMPYVIQLEFLCLCLLNLTLRYGKCLFLLEISHYLKYLDF